MQNESQGRKIYPLTGEIMDRADEREWKMLQTELADFNPQKQTLAEKRKEGIKDTMKRILSWVVLLISIIVCSMVVSLVSNFAVALATRLYDSSRGIFWVVIICGGSFGLGIAYYIAVLTAPLCIRISQAIKPSVNGTRYKVFAIITGIYYIINIISSLILNVTGTLLAKVIIVSALMLLFSIVLFAMGKDTSSCGIE